MIYADNWAKNEKVLKLPKLVVLTQQTQDGFSPADLEFGLSVRTDDDTQLGRRDYALGEQKRLLNRSINDVR